MEIQVTSTPAASGSAVSTGTAQSTKSNGGKSVFNNLLQNAGNQTSEKKVTDPMTAVLALLAGGLNPLALQQQMPTVMTADGVKTTTSAADVMLGNRTMAVPVAGLPLQSGDLAQLLQQFGGSAKLLGVLQENPSLPSGQVLSAHPEVLSDFGQALTNLVQQTVQNPQLLLASPKAAALMESLFAQLLQAEGTDGQASTNTPSTGANTTATKQPQFGKLQAATITAVNLQVQATPEAQTVSVVPSSQATAVQGMQVSALTAALLSSDNPTQEQAKSSGTPLDATQWMTNLLAGGQTPLQSVNAERLAKLPTVINMQGNQFQNQFADLVVKRATMLEAPGRHEFRIVLQPQGLGEIEVRVQAVGNQISLQMSADSSATKGLLDSSLSSLKSQLQAQGIQLDRIEVSSANTNNSTNQNNNGSLSSGLPQDRQSGQGFQGGQSGKESNRRQSGERFTIDALDAADAAAFAEETDTTDEASLDVTA
ncbi:flagellar hook-length control protein FliK [Tumebacillus flagellatus]|uniref:Flagellar hook-length control protein-like C-terminal domain-containing protein n=1 Tax=Tumebacillus flagellatus TaxID=1157490 RepID=A0A074LPA6_9BACL|nr:flagellar hook-length control protein FliK [Tumebacillus flagellatus]KEO82934.1 hypothetical protein EL26_12625 [Tumebacillus flagellatus]